jgi:hypothetical protein
MARARAIEEGSPGNVAFTVADAGDIGPGPFDVVAFFDSLHDLGDPRPRSAAPASCYATVA